MTIKQKILLLAVLPLVLALAAITGLVNYQARALVVSQSEVVFNALMDIRKRELKNYASLARGAVEHVYSDNAIDDGTAQQIVKRILTDLDYSEDGYFFAYTTEGVNVVHPRQPFRIDQNWWSLTDRENRPVIQNLITEAKNGGGYTEYQWEKPSEGAEGRKLGYAELLPRWQWMYGTGIYIDDIDRQVSLISALIGKQVNDTSIVIILVAIAAVAGVFASGLWLQINERKLADEQLQQLNRRIVTTQDEERRRVSRDLHDGISQSLVAIKYSLEAAEARVRATNTEAAATIAQTAKHLDTTLDEVRHISRDLHPGILDDLGLMAATESLVNQFKIRTGIDTTLEIVAVRNLLPQDARTAFYRVVQEALTNIEKHANATRVDVSFRLDNGSFVLSVIDNGSGFDVTQFQRSRQPTRGIGLRNMAERMSFHTGELVVTSSSRGTRITASVPQRILNYKNVGSGTGQV